jgi:hypothetical protein
MSRTAQYFTHCLRMTLEYAERLVADIPAEIFAHIPHPQMNHPAFCIGHLSLYPNRLFAMLNRTELVVEKAGFPELFQAGVACVEQDGRYPHKDVIVAYYLERYRKMSEILPNVDENAFAKPNPVEGKMRERMPLVGMAVNFLLNNHNMMHLGQVSAWRRAVGLGPAL